MDNHLSPERIEQLITTAVRRGRRQQKLRHVATGAAALVVVAAVAVGASNLLDGTNSGPNPTVANPATTTDEASQPVRTPSPSPTTTATTAAPSPDPNAKNDFSTSYTEAEQQLILQQLSRILEGRDSEGFTVVVSRTTWVDGLTALSPDVEITGADDTPAFTLRVSGPFGKTTITGGSFFDSQTAELVGAYTLFGADGRSYAGTQIHQAPDGSTPTMPPVDPRYEHDAATIELQQVTLPTLAIEPRALSEEEQSLADELLNTFGSLLPSGVEVADIPDSSPDGAVFTLQSDQTSARGEIAFWHLTPGADGCLGSDCTAVPVDDGTVYIDDTFDSPEAPTRSYTYRRNDDAAIYFTISTTSESNEGAGQDVSLPLTEDQMVPLLTDPAWTPFLDRKKAEPPQ